MRPLQRPAVAAWPAAESIPRLCGESPLKRTHVGPSADRESHSWDLGRIARQLIAGRTTGRRSRRRTTAWPAAESIPRLLGGSPLKRTHGGHLGDRESHSWDLSRIARQLVAGRASGARGRQAMVGSAWKLLTLL